MSKYEYGTDADEMGGEVQALSTLLASCAQKLYDMVGSEINLVIDLVDGRTIEVKVKEAAGNANGESS